jgi:NADH:ubiquinone oxidoreductase subunit K
MTGTIPLNYFLVISTLMFFIGIYGFLTRRNLITMLMSVELILNSVNINFVVFNRYLFPQHLTGLFFSLIVIAVAAAEAAVAIAIIINIYRNFKSIDVDNVDQMRF